MSPIWLAHMYITYVRAPIPRGIDQLSEQEVYRRFLGKRWRLKRKKLTALHWISNTRMLRQTHNYINPHCTCTLRVNYVSLSTIVLYIYGLLWSIPIENHIHCITYPSFSLSIDIRVEGTWKTTGIHKKVDLWCVISQKSVKIFGHVLFHLFLLESVKLNNYKLESLHV